MEYIKLKFIILIVFCSITNSIAYSQNYAQNNDSTHASEWMQDMPFKQDTTVEIPVTEIQAPPGFIKKNLVNLINQANGTQAKTHPQKEKSETENGTFQYNNIYIKKINIIQLSTFGPEVKDTSSASLNWLQQAGNKTHINTFEVIIRNRLLMEAGDKINPIIINDNERLVRELPYIKDAHIEIEYDTAVGDSAIINLFVKDKWPAAFSYEYYTSNSAVIGLWNQNIFGTGHEIALRTKYDLERSPKANFKGKYRVHNIYNTQISGQVDYENDWDNNYYSFSLNRSHLTPEIKYAGGFQYSNLSKTQNIRENNIYYENLSSRNDYYDAWLGRSFLILPFNNMFTRTNLFINVRYSQYNFTERPESYIPNWYYYYNRTIFLASLGIAEQGFFKTVLVNGFGDTEDIPFGKNFNFILGKEHNDSSNRFYAGLEIAAGGYFPGFGYLYNKASISSFYKDDLEQGQLTYHFDYFTPIFGIKNYLFRYFSRIYFRGGFNRWESDYFVVKKSEGVRGMENHKLYARQELTINNELVLYSPHVLLGFRFVYFAFFDLSIYDHQDKELFTNPVYTGIGAGVRIRNSHLAFNTIRIRLSYYPTFPTGSGLEQFQLVGAGLNRPNQFSIPPPKITQFDNRF